jgi:hypothetical protein
VEVFEIKGEGRESRRENFVNMRPSRVDRIDELLKSYVVRRLEMVGITG